MQYKYWRVELNLEWRQRCNESRCFGLVRGQSQNSPLALSGRKATSSIGWRMKTGLAGFDVGGGTYRNEVGSGSPNDEEAIVNMYGLHLATCLIVFVKAPTGLGGTTPGTGSSLKSIKSASALRFKGVSSWGASSSDMPSNSSFSTRPEFSESLASSFRISPSTLTYPGLSVGLYPWRSL